MKIYNTLTKKKEEFEPIEPGKVKMYVCGPTVYDYIHIGNARPYVIFDCIRKYMEYRGFEVNYVQNFTDVDDKIIKKANDEHVDMQVISDRYIKEALQDAEGLNVKKPSSTPRVTEEMDEIIEMIDTLIQKGHAYVVGGTVYFDTKSFKGYGKLSGKNIDDLEAGARIEVDTDKKHPCDFVLWKPNKEGEPKWVAPWGDGRPGWHIECSVMAKKYLGDSIDIHAGGEDLVFPHHENEIAQSEAANGVPFSKYWLHNGFINIDNEKMSKSKGNFFTLREIAAEIPYDVIRFFILSGHYRSPINFSRELMTAAQHGLDRIKECIKSIDFIAQNATATEMSADETALVAESNKFRRDFEESMDNDFNTADALASIFDFVKFANIHVTATASKPFATEIKDNILQLCDVLGIQTTAENVQFSMTDEEIEACIAERQQAKAAKDFKRADEIRDQLNSRGIVLQDTPSGVRYSHKSL